MVENGERRRLELPDRRKHTYASLEKRIDDHADHIEGSLAKWIRRGLVAFTIISVGCILALIGYGIILREIQDQRHEACTAQNTRHDRTITLFQDAAAKLIREHPEQADQVRENIGTNLRIINALAPKQNCDQVAPERGILP